jgi:hypothetical protein
MRGVYLPVVIDKEENVVSSSLARAGNAGRNKSGLASSARAGGDSHVRILLTCLFGGPGHRSVLFCHSNGIRRRRVVKVHAQVSWVSLRLGGSILNLAAAAIGNEKPLA